MKSTLVRELNESLAHSNAETRKHWARQMVEQDVPLDALISLLHADEKTAQRFTWFLDDVCRLDPDRIEPFLPLLFSLRDQMTFPGMFRSVAKWLWLAGVPTSIEKEATQQLLDWLADPGIRIAPKSFGAKALEQLVKEGGLARDKLIPVVQNETKNSNRAYAGRMQKLLDRLVDQT